MKISSEELGKVLIAFGQLLTKGGIDNMENTKHVYTMPAGAAGDADVPTSDYSHKVLNSFTESASEDANKVTTGSFEAGSGMVTEPTTNVGILPELGETSMQSTPNKSGLDLKPIKL